MILRVIPKMPASLQGRQHLIQVDLEVPVNPRAQLLKVGLGQEKIKLLRPQEFLVLFSQSFLRYWINKMLQAFLNKKNPWKVSIRNPTRVILRQAKILKYLNLLKIKWKELKNSRKLWSLKKLLMMRTLHLSQCQ